MGGQNIIKTQILGESKNFWFGYVLPADIELITILNRIIKTLNANADYTFFLDNISQRTFNQIAQTNIYSHTVFSFSHLIILTVFLIFLKIMNDEIWNKWMMKYSEWKYKWNMLWKKKQYVKKKKKSTKYIIFFQFFT